MLNKGIGNVFFKEGEWCQDQHHPPGKNIKQ